MQTYAALEEVYVNQDSFKISEKLFKHIIPKIFSKS